VADRQCRDPRGTPGRRWVFRIVSTRPSGRDADNPNTKSPVTPSSEESLRLKISLCVKNIQLTAVTERTNITR